MAKQSTPARWYMLNKDGMATLCVDKADADQEAKKADASYPNCAPHRAVLMGEVAPPATAQAISAEPAGAVLPDAHGAVMGAAYDFRDAHLSGSANEKRSAHEVLDTTIRDALRASHGQAPAQQADPSITLDFKQASELLEMFGGEAGLMTLQRGGAKCHSGPGLYAWYSDVPEEGAEFLGTEPDDEATPQAADTGAAQVAGITAGVSIPTPIPSLTGDAALAHEQCRAVVHLAFAVVEVYTANAAIVANDARLADQIGEASAHTMEWLADLLNSTDAVSEDDEWIDPIIEAAQERWPVAATPQPAPPADSVLEDAALLTSEQEYAIRQGHEIAASDGYFDARPQIESNDRRKVFQAGFERGWDAARKQGGAT